MTVKYSAVSKDERDKTEWFCLRLGFISKFYDFIVRIKQFGKHCQIFFFSLRLLYTNCNNVALPYFTFWYLPEISKFKKKSERTTLSQLHVIIHIHVYVLIMYPFTEKCQLKIKIHHILFSLYSTNKILIYKYVYMYIIFILYPLNFI